MNRRSQNPPSFRERAGAVVGAWPWWLALALCAGAYLGLRRVAEHPEAGAADGSAPPSAAASMVAALPWHTINAIGPYLLCALVLLAVAVAFVLRRRWAALDGESLDAAGAVAGMDLRDFEELMGEAFTLQGYQVSQTGGGVDMVLRKARESSLLHCKHWRKGKVGVAELRAFHAVMTARSIGAGIVVTTGRFSRDTFSFAGRHGMKLIDGPALLPMIRLALGARARAAAPSEPTVMMPMLAPADTVPMDTEPMSDDALLPATAPAAVAPVSAVRVKADPLCRKCGSPMLLRTVRRGSRAGRLIWSCMNFPDCKGTRKAI